MAIFTLEENTNINKNKSGDGDMTRENVCEDLECNPTDLSISKILGYSKALSVRKSAHIDTIKMIIN